MAPYKIVCRSLNPTPSVLADPCNAPMQVAMECAKEMGCRASIVDFVMPLGTTVNMNGTALYEATTVIFLAQVRPSAETVHHPHVAGDKIRWVLYRRCELF